MQMQMQVQVQVQVQSGSLQSPCVPGRLSSVGSTVISCRCGGVFEVPGSDEQVSVGDRHALVAVAWEMRRADICCISPWP